MERKGREWKRLDVPEAERKGKKEEGKEGKERKNHVTEGKGREGKGRDCFIVCLKPCKGRAVKGGARRGGARRDGVCSPISKYSLKRERRV